MTSPSPAQSEPRSRTARLRRLAWLVLVTFVFGLCAASVGHLLHSWGGAPEIAHADGAPCPDPADADHPCGPGCPCACCHAPIALLPPAPSGAPVRVLSGWESTLPAPDGWLPLDVRRRIFHPPRA